MPRPFSIEALIGVPEAEIGKLAGASGIAATAQTG